MATQHYQPENTNQGIVDGRAEGRQPSPAPVTLDTVKDEDASATEALATSAQDTLVGATSADVHASAGQPGSGMSSKELHHNGMPGRKRDGQGVDQWGQGGQK